MRERPPSAVLMRPSRWFWYSGNNGAASTEPVVRPGTGNIPEDSDVGPFGPLSGGLPVFLDASIPSTLGVGANQDTIVLVRARDLVLLEDEPRFSAMVDQVGGNLSVVLTFHNYACLFSSRYPSGIGTVSGTGLVTPTGW